MMSRPQKVESYREREIGRKRKIKLDTETDRERTDRTKEDRNKKRKKRIKFKMLLEKILTECSTNYYNFSEM